MLLLSSSPSSSTPRRLPAFLFLSSHIIIMPSELEPPADTIRNAHRGHISSCPSKTIQTPAGQVAWSFEDYEFLEESKCPDTVAPMLWRQAQLCSLNGLFLVTEGIYQVRGLDAANMTIVEGDTGVVVVDPLMSTETAAEGLRLYREHRGHREVAGLIYTHPHGDHFAGALGVSNQESDIPVLAPEDFMFHAINENIVAGAPMNRRADFQFGTRLPRGGHGHVACGTCLAASDGSRGFILPTISIKKTGQTEKIDGISFVFQMTPGTEAPAEMNFLIPGRRALCVAENASQSLHNVTPLRGAMVRDTKAWSSFLDETIARFTDNVDVCFGGHNWPTWGNDEIKTFLGQQRDLYAFLHDQTVFLMSQGLTGVEIAENFELPDGLKNVWHAQSFYGSLTHNVKCIYQQYLGWYDGNPAHLWEHPPAEAGARYVRCMGGIDEVIRKAAQFVADGDLRFAATLLNHAVFAEPTNVKAKSDLAEVYETLAWTCICGPWRDSFLTAALELREGVPDYSPVSHGSGILKAASVGQILTALSVRINGRKAQSESCVVDLRVVDCKETHRVSLSNGALICRDITSETSARGHVGVCSMTKQDLLTMVMSGVLPKDIEDLEGQGTEATQIVSLIMSYMEPPNPSFNIVVP